MNKKGEDEKPKCDLLMKDQTIMKVARKQVFADYNKVMEIKPKGPSTMNSWLASAVRVRP